MYTFNYFVYGHDLSKDKEINNRLIEEYDFEIREEINGMKFEVEFPYHGGQVAGDTYSCVFGINITDDDQNPNFTQEVREAKEEDYREAYDKFITRVIELLDDGSEDYDEDETPYDEDYIDFRNKFEKFLKENEPGFYMVEASS